MTAKELKEERLKEVERAGKKGRGKKEYMAYLQGKKITPKASILAKCYECGGYYSDGTKDCEMVECALHPFMAYNANKQKPTRVMSDENKKKAAERMAMRRSPNKKTEGENE